MNLKRFAVLIILFTIVIAGVSAFGLGAQFNFNAGQIFAPGAALLISPGDITHIAFNWYLDFDKKNVVGFTADLAPLTLPISKFGIGSFNFTLGIGLFANVVLTNDPGVDGGLRIPFGLNILLVRDIFEIFAHIAPSFGVHFLPSLGLSRPFFPIAIGARFWIR